MPATALLIPGNMCDARLWNGADAVLRQRLSALGLSIADADTSRDDTIASMATRALSAVDGPLIPIGFSMGAIIALAMAAQAPDRISGLALFGLNAGADLPERSSLRIRQQADVAAGELERVIVEELKPNYLAAANRRNTDLSTLLHDMGMALGPAVFRAQSEALRLRPDFRDVLRGLDVPVLLGCGAEDSLCPPAWHNIWADLAADSEVAIFEGAGHMLPLELPQEFADQITDWIRKRVPHD